MKEQKVQNIQTSWDDVNRLLVDIGYLQKKAMRDTKNSFAQTSVNISGGTESDTSFSVNSLMKFGEIAKDDEGDLKLAFSQARFATATNEIPTINLV